ncbi:caspase-3-like [Lytechinus variegatus]|uniref:caspase-3-like n=1 Tax=Lytechinus variegatus TaxID=7654 RepID=UPI001BB2BDB9|nr:caspase-3-like [Lytechinus variegatus]XP_041465968.1 caspase-3-like [Lytechinus variegatus]
MKQAILTDTSIELNREMCYPMDKPDKGIAFILNNYLFKADRAFERKGSNIDLVNVKHVFKEIGYSPKEAQNLTAEGIRMELNSLKKNILHSHTSVVLVFMSHGVPEGILGTDQKVVTVEEIKNMFSGNNCPALIGKPKIMFFQACRGDKVTPCASPNNKRPEEGPENSNDIVSTDGSTRDGRVELATDEGESSKPDRSMVKASPDNIEGSEVDTDGGVPDNADVYIAHATPEGYFSLRDKQNGSWFIQALCEELIASAHAHHLDDIMMKVTDRVKQHECNIMVGGKRRLTQQTPQIVKQGIGKKIYFLPKYQPVHPRSKATELKSQL